MVTGLAALMFALAIGCDRKVEPPAEKAAPVPSVRFYAFDIKQLDGRNPPPQRTAFTLGEVVAVVMIGEIRDKQMFIELNYNGQHTGVSETLTGNQNGKWFSMGRLPRGAYRAVLFVEGIAVADTAFWVVP